MIDPQYDVLPYLDLTAERGYTITGVIDGAKASVIWGAEDEIDK